MRLEYMRLEYMRLEYHAYHVKLSCMVPSGLYLWKQLQGLAGGFCLCRLLRIALHMQTAPCSLTVACVTTRCADHRDVS